MANTPSKRWTVKDVLAMARQLTRTVEQRNILTEQGRYFYNAALSEVVSLLNSSLDPAYFVNESITPSSDILTKYSITSIASEISSIGVHTITITSASFVVGQILVISYDDKVAAPLTAYGTYVGRVVSISPDKKTATCTPLNAITLPAAAPYYDSFLTIINPYSSGQFDTTLLTYSLDRIVSIIDSVYGQCVEIPVNVYHSINRTGITHTSYENDIAWTMIGNVIYFKNGSRVTSPGTKTVVYQRQPNYPTLYDATEYPDISDKYVPLLVKRIYTYILLQMGSDIPNNLAQELQADYGQISAFAQSEMENKMKGVTQVKDGGK